MSGALGVSGECSGKAFGDLRGALEETGGALEVQGRSLESPVGLRGVSGEGTRVLCFRTNGEPERQGRGRQRTRPSKHSDEYVDMCICIYIIL